jgi:hypothetical protein
MGISFEDALAQAKANPVSGKAEVANVISDGH